MQLRTARLCLDCEEVHDKPRCPACASETFTYMTHWIPAPERRHIPRPTTSPQAEVLRTLIAKEPDPGPSNSRRMLRQGVVGLTALGLVGWFLRRRSSDASNGRDNR